MSDTQRQTRSTNKDKHPGLPDVDEETLARPIPRPKRTRVQILADAAAAQRKKDEKLKEEQREVARKAAGIEEIARLESKMKADEEKSALNAAHPPATPQTRKVARPLGDVASLEPRYPVVDRHHTVSKPKGNEVVENDNEEDFVEDDEILSVVSSHSGTSALAVD